MENLSSYLRHSQKSIDLLKEYFYVKALETVVIGFELDENSQGTMYYSTDKITWKSCSSGFRPAFSKNNIIYFKSDITGTTKLGKLNIEGKCDIGGNIMSLLYGDDFIGKTEVTIAMCSIFDGCPIVDASKLKLPATVLTIAGCYSYMFSDCINLVSAPELPATTLTQHCYGSMFSGCTSLVNVPEILPATTLATSCYSSMFYGCSSLVTAPEFPIFDISYDYTHEDLNVCLNTM